MATESLPAIDMAKEMADDTAGTISLDVLVVDDSPVNQALITTIVQRLGHRTRTAKDGEAGLSAYREHRPDMVLMDVMMPVMDGIAATREIRAHDRDTGRQRWTPIIILSALSGQDDVLAGISAGADDYLPKPINVQLLEAKIHAFERMIGLQRTVERNLGDLLRYRDDAERETRFAAHLMEQLLGEEPGVEGQIAAYRLPAEQFNGDVVVSATAPNGNHYLLLGDATGHGLPAAISAVPVVSTFRAMVAKGFSLPAVVRELNGKLKGFLPPERFVAATVAMIDPAEGMISVWNGGNPDAKLFDDAGILSWSFKSQHLPLGILDGASFDDRCETVHYPYVGRWLTLNSDGLTDATDATGETLGTRFWDECVRTGNLESSAFTAIARINTHLDGENPPDDISWLLVDLNTLAIPRQATVSAQAERSDMPPLPVGWSLQARYPIVALRDPDLAPRLVDQVCALPALNDVRGPLYLVLSELFNNALDHGLLGLDSELKSVEDGFERWMSVRAERLASLEEGMISISLEIQRLAGRHSLLVEVSDSGKGFNYAPYLVLSPDRIAASQIHGRGIALIRGMCQEIIFHPPGNRVQIRLPLDLGQAPGTE